MFCPKCGAQCADGTTFCPTCGAPLNQGTPVYTGTVQGAAASGISPRNIALAIVLSIITCGIYGIYWFIVLTDETNQLAEPNGTSGGMAFLFTLITCGIYGWFWAAKMGNKVDQIKGTPGGSSNVLFVLLQLFGLGIVNYAIAQDAVNKAVQ